MRLKKPDPGVLEALASIEGRDWSVVMEWLQESNDAGLRNMRDARDDIDMRQWQGATQALDELIEHQRGARAALKRLQDSR